MRRLTAALSTVKHSKLSVVFVAEEMSMKKYLALSLILCGSASSAQFIISGFPGGTSSRGASYQGTAPLNPTFGLNDDGITPTMRRERETRAKLVDTMYPDLKNELARHSPSRARMLYAVAERKAIWANIKARRRSN
jgi:hypothetical protein